MYLNPGYHIIIRSYSYSSNVTYSGRHFVNRSPFHVNPQFPLAVPSILKCW